HEEQRQVSPRQELARATPAVPAGVSRACLPAAGLWGGHDESSCEAPHPIWSVGPPPGNPETTARTRAALPTHLASTHAQPDRRAGRKGRRFQEDRDRAPDRPVLQERDRERRRDALPVPPGRLRQPASLSIR